MTDQIKQAMSGQEITALLTEAARQELGRITLQQDSAPHGHPVIQSCGLAPVESFVVEVVLGENGEADAIHVSGGDGGENLFSFDRNEAAGSAASKHSAILAAAKKFREIVGTHPLRLPRSPQKRAAIESFHALG
ncbi:hypothetical protein ACFMBG_15480 [Leisingera sp. D0M16]|uniref:hypothetical protein n=1 Tax=Leisingera coralii TaxID=3351347 RepID=UPI003B810285